MTDQTAAPTIDCHAHVFAGDTALNRDAWIKPAAPAAIGDYRRVLKQAHIARAVLAASSLHADGTAYTTAVTAADPDIRTTVIVTPGVAREELQMLAQAGACGIRLQLRNKQIPDLRSVPYRRLLRDVRDLGWHVQLHDDCVRLPPVMAIVEDSGVPLVIDHFGRPGPDGVADAGFRAVLAAVARGRTWVKISSAFRLPVPVQDRALADALLDAGGTDRLMWGSDWPFVGFETQMSYELALAHFVRAVPEAATRDAIDHTALRFYFPHRFPDGR